MRRYTDPDTLKLYRIVMTGKVYGSDKTWTSTYGPYTQLTKAKEIFSRLHRPKGASAWIEETDVWWQRLQ